MSEFGVWGLGLSVQGFGQECVGSLKYPAYYAETTLPYSSTLVDASTQHSVVLELFVWVRHLCSTRGNALQLSVMDTQCVWDPGAGDTRLRVGSAMLGCSARAGAGVETISMANAGLSTRGGAPPSSRAGKEQRGRLGGGSMG
jgi:hypothetical protein